MEPRGEGTWIETPRDRVSRILTRQPGLGQCRPSSAAGRQNNVYADRNGNVQRRNNNGSWDSRTKGGWQPNIGGGNRAGGSPSNMNRDYQSRQRGSSRTQSYNRSRGGGGGR